MEKKLLWYFVLLHKATILMDEIKNLGNKIILVTSENLKEKTWPLHAIGRGCFLCLNLNRPYESKHLIQGFPHLIENPKIKCCSGIG